MNTGISTPKSRRDKAMKLNAALKDAEPKRYFVASLHLALGLIHVSWFDSHFDAEMERNARRMSDAKKIALSNRKSSRHEAEIGLLKAWGNFPVKHLN